jgi:GT2 family glycosyltransferase/glycosyltransferase involved in cell wall biosynthesis
MARPTKDPASDEAQQIATLEATVERLERELAQNRALLTETAETRRSNAAELDRTRAELRALKGRRSVKVAIATGNEARHVYRIGRRIGGALRRRVRSLRRRLTAVRRDRGRRATPAAEEALVAALRASLPGTAVVHGPLVSIVILNRDGREHLERCLGALSSTAYRDIEVIVVDNGSTDGSAELAESIELPFPLRVIRNTTNRSYSEANGQAVAIADGTLVCFLNNDVDPITDDWLGYLVETIDGSGAVAVGARLIYPRQRGVRAGSKHADLTVQHAGVAFDRSKAVPLARAIGAGEDPLAPWVSAVETRPALTAACLLVRVDAFREVGGFSPEYDYGTEDVDLCLKLRAAGGRLVYDGRAAMWHHESATRVADRARYTARVAANRDTFIGRWGPRIFRDALLDALDGGTQFSTDAYHVAVTVGGPGAPDGFGDRPTGRLLGRALEAFGWRVSYVVSTGDTWDEPDLSVEAIVVRHADFDVRRLPGNVTRIAWLDDDPARWVGRAWFDEFDVVLAADDDAAALVRDRSAKVARVVPVVPGGPREANTAPFGPPTDAIRQALRDWASATRYGLRIGVPSWQAIDRWGDYHFARGLQRALERAGHPTRVHLLPDWGSPAAARDDVAVHVFGLKEAPTHPGQVNVLWQISHPDLATPELYQRYDHVFVASDPFAARMAARVTVPVVSLHQATDPERFRPEPGGPHHELLFVANSHKIHRRIIDDLAGTTRDLAIYGRYWTPDLVDQRHVKGELIPNTELARYYSAADIVLNDHWDDMRTEGFISNRIYDALACGAFVISDPVDGIETEFDGAVATYRARAELEPLIARYLDDPEERRRLAAHGRAIVLERHTFDLRAQALSDVAEALARARPAIVDGTAIAS